MKRGLLLTLLVLGACAPRQQVGPQPGTLPEAQVRALLGVFVPELQRRGIAVEIASGQTVTPASEEALTGAVKAFYAVNPGFCALLDDPFVADSEQQRFMTIASKGSEVRVLIYDRSDAVRLSTVRAAGRSAKPLPARPCQSGK